MQTSRPGQTKDEMDKIASQKPNKSGRGTGFKRRTSEDSFVQLKTTAGEQQPQGLAARKAPDQIGDCVLLVASAKTVDNLTQSRQRTLPNHGGHVYFALDLVGPTIHAHVAGGLFACDVVVFVRAIPGKLLDADVGAGCRHPTVDRKHDIGPLGLRTPQKGDARNTR